MAFVVLQGIPTYAPKTRLGIEVTTRPISDNGGELLARVVVVAATGMTCGPRPAATQARARKLTCWSQMWAPRGRMGRA